MGDFTARFDREILQSQFAEIEAKMAAEKEQAEVDRIDLMLAEIAKILVKRAKFVEERFPNAQPLGSEVAGFRFAFEQTGDRVEARFLIQASVNESRLAIRVCSRYEVPSRQKDQRDYVTLPTTQPNIDRARRFIESKLFDFARSYVTE